MMLKITEFLLFALLFNCHQFVRAQSGIDSTGIISTEKHFNFCNQDQEIIHHSYFSLAYNDSAEQADWVAYKLTSDHFKPGIERTNDFREDTMVVTGSASLSDYSGSGYDKGHLAPAGSMKRSVRAMSESFLMSNISPQLPSFNRGIWKRLEEKIRYWTDRCDSLVVISGPILDRPITVIGLNKVAVPRAYFKTIVAFKGAQEAGIAFLIPHSASFESIYRFTTSIDAIEEMKGVDFYCNLNLENMEAIESNENIKVFVFGN